MARDGERPEFHDSAKRAKLLIENQYERKLDRDGPAGAIFALNKIGWSDRQEVEVKGALAHLDPSQLPDEPLSRMAAGEHPLSVLASAQIDSPPAGLLLAGEDAEVEGDDLGD